MAGGMKRSCIIGWPVEHSRSPLIHGFWLKHYGLDGAYGREAVPPEGLDDFIRTLRARGYVGCNVTIPHKERAAELVSPADDLSRRLGAVNTIYFEGDEIVGTNTDVYGFAAHLRASVPDFTLAGAEAMVLGAGGAARAVSAALVEQGARRIYICNRSLARAESLARSLGPKLEALDWHRAPEAMAGVDLLVNATALGMKGKPELDLSLDALPLSAVVYDIVYVPVETSLLKRARRRGHRTVDGLGMLLHQAQPAFAKWFGLRPDITPELRRLIEQDIGASVPQ
jgi:shikimate dehydrogenase